MQVGRVVRVVDMAFSALWGIGALSIFTSPSAEVIQAVTEVVPALGNTGGSAVMASVAGLEAFLAADLALGSTQSARWRSAVFLCGLIAWLLIRGVHAGWGVRCGCLSLLFEGSVLTAVIRNALLLSVLAAAMVFVRRSHGRPQVARHLPGVDAPVPAGPKPTP